MDNKSNQTLKADYSEILENEHTATILVIVLPLFFLAIFISFLVIALSKSEEKRENIIRIICYILIQFICLHFLIIFIFINLILISISFLCFEKLKYLSTKKVYEYFKSCCINFCSKKDVISIRIEKRVHNNINPAESYNYKGVNNDSKSNSKSLDMNKFSDNLNLNNNNYNNKNIDLNLKNNNPNALSNNMNNNNNDLNIHNINHNLNLNTNSDKNNNDNTQNLRMTGIANSNLNNNTEFNLHSETVKEKNLCEINKNNMINNNINCNDLGRVELVNKNEILSKNEENTNNQDKNKKVNIFMTLNNSRPLPVNKKSNKRKIIDFLSDVLLNKDNSPSYINLLKNIKNKSAEKLEKRMEAAAAILHK